MDSKRSCTLKDLLELSIAHSSSGSEVNLDNRLHDIDEENRHFLQNVLNAMSTDVIEELARAIAILEEEDGSKKAEKSQALALIRDYVCNLDFANSFLKLGGSNILLKLTQHKCSELRNCALQTIAEIAQNNTFAQQHFCERKALEILLNYLVHPKEETIASSLYAISSLVRSCDAAVKQLMRLGGPKMILECSQMSCQRVMTKSCFIIAALATEHNYVCEEFIRLNAFIKLSRILQCTKEYNVKTECTLRALAALSKHPDFLNNNSSASQQLIVVLQKIIQCNSSLPECEETVDYCRQLLDKLPK